MMQRTLIILKPEAIERNIVGTVLKNFDRDDFKLIAMYSKRAASYMYRSHYKDVLKRVSTEVGDEICARMSRGACIFAVYEGPDVIAIARELIGATDPAVGGDTIRGRHGSSVQYNVIHGSDSPESATREIELWFPELSAGEKLTRGC